MQASPSLTTLLFTDIEGSTRLWEQDGEGMSRALMAHDAASRSAVEENHGVVIKMTGDGIYAAFDEPLDALTATIALQRALEAQAAESGTLLRVRAGLHLGIVERRDSDLFGSSVNRAARITKAAHGGQILISQAVVDRISGRLSEPLSIRDLGAVRLRDLAASEHLYQLVHPDLQQAFPALRSLEATPNNLPSQLTSFIGRTREVSEAKALLEKARLVTLVGMGGLGKTRLSLQIGADVLDKYLDGVWFVDLAPVNDQTLVTDAVAQALRVREEAGRPLIGTLCSHLRERKLLLILDNCEHLIGACATVSEALLGAAPQLRILATSREALRIRGEQICPVVPLALPSRPADVDDLIRSEAAQLFADRVRLCKPDFVLTAREAPVVAELCKRLEGIPLALELAAARLRSLSIEEINKRLNDRFKLLAGGSRVASARQQTMHALISWSYDLLEEQEQILFDRLSVFMGGCDLAAAESVCGVNPLSPENVLDLMTSLVDKSVVVVRQENGISRYGMLETIREFAHDKLINRNDLATTAARHCDYYLEFAKKARVQLHGMEQAEWTHRVEVDLDNLRAGIALALGGGLDPVAAVKFEVAIMRFRTLRGYSTEGRNNIRNALALPGIKESKLAHAHALYTGAVLAQSQSDHREATNMLTECLAIRRSLGDKRHIAATLSTLSTSWISQRELSTARGCADEALGLFREIGDRMGEAISLINLGEVVREQGDVEGAARFFRTALRVAKEIEHQELESESERHLGDLALRRKDLIGAASCLTRSLQISHGTEDKRGEAITLWFLGRVCAASGRQESAMDYFGKALPAFHAFGMHSEALGCLEDCADLLQATGQNEDAVRVYGASSAVRDALGLRSREAEAKRQSNLEVARGALGSDAFADAWALGRSWSIEQATRRALAQVDVPQQRA